MTDGAVGFGPLFWTTDIDAHGYPVAAPDSSDSAWARDIVIQAWEKRFNAKPTLAQAQIVQAIFRFEGGYGKGWVGNGLVTGPGTPSVSQLVEGAKASHNWGAVQCCLPGGKGAPVSHPPDPPNGQCNETTTFLWQDTNPKTTPSRYWVCFKRYPDDVSGALDALRIATSSAAEKAAWASGDVRAISTAMYDAHYYGSPYPQRDKAIDFHVNAIIKNATSIAAALGEPLAVTSLGVTPGPDGIVTPGNAGAGLGLLAAAAIGGYLLLHGVAVGEDGIPLSEHRERWPHDDGGSATGADVDYVKQHLEAVNTGYERLDADVKRGTKAKKIDASTRQSLGYKWSYAYQDWLQYYAGVQTSGIVKIDSDNVETQVLHYEAILNDYRGQVTKAMGGDVTPTPPSPVEPPSVVPALGLGVGAGVFATVAGGMIVYLLTRELAPWDHLPMSFSKVSRIFSSSLVRSFSPRPWQKRPTSSSTGLPRQTMPWT